MRPLYPLNSALYITVFAKKLIIFVEIYNLMI